MGIRNTDAITARVGTMFRASMQPHQPHLTQGYGDTSTVREGSDAVGL